MYTVKTDDAHPVFRRRAVGNTGRLPLRRRCRSVAPPRLSAAAPSVGARGRARGPPEDRRRRSCVRVLRLPLRRRRRTTATRRCRRPLSRACDRGKCACARPCLRACVLPLPPRQRSSAVVVVAATRHTQSVPDVPVRSECSAIVAIRLCRTSVVRRRRSVINSFRVSAPPLTCAAPITDARVP